MKADNYSNTLKLIGEKTYRPKEVNGKFTLKQEIDFYLVAKNNERVYAFTRKFTDHSWDIVKSGVLVNKVLRIHTGDPGVNGMVNQTKRMVPYLVEEYGLT